MNPIGQLPTTDRDWTLTDCSRILLVQNAQISRALCELVDAARHTILIVQYQFRAPHSERPAMRSILAALREAAARGVEIRILLNHPHHTTRQQPDHGRLREALATPGITIRHYLTTRILHAKLAVVDEQAVLLGSHNLSQPSFATSLNTSVIIYAPTLALRITRTYDQLWHEAHHG